MNLIPPIPPRNNWDDPVYPSSDGQPMADNTKQLRWIVVIYDNLSALFREASNVFVGGNQFWYPVEGEPSERLAPDVYVVFGRPKGDRPSYKQWEEANLPMTVVFEVLSPGNTPMEMADKQDFYERHGVEEYYVFDPEKMALHMYLRQGEVLRRVRHLKDFVSPRLGIRFDLTGDEMVVFGPDGQRFLSFEELKTAQARAEARADQAEQRADQAQAHVERAEARADQAEARAEEAEARADQAEKRAANAEATTAKAELLRKRLAELSRKARRGQASPEELAELERLEANGTSNS